jgi:hypothetical protein
MIAKCVAFEVIENFGFVASRHLKLFLLLCHVKTLFLGVTLVCPPNF